MKFLITKQHLQYLYLFSGIISKDLKKEEEERKKPVAVFHKAQSFPKVLIIIHLHLNMKYVLLCPCCQKSFGRKYFHIETFSIKGSGRYFKRK